MLNFSKIKIAFITSICFLSLWFALPSMLPQETTSPIIQKVRKILPNHNVNLGLDLRGGSQLMLEIDFDYYAREQMRNLKDEIKNSFHDESIHSLPILDGDKVTFTILDITQRSLVTKLVKKISSQIEINDTDGRFEIYFSKERIAQIRKDLIRQSIEIVRHRIDESGTKEPVIQAQGSDRILLQVPGVKDSSELKNILGKTAKMTFHFVDERTFSPQVGSVMDFNLEKLKDSEGRIYLIKKEVVLSGDLLVDANTTYYEGKPAVSFKFNDLGTKKFAQITRENVGKFFAIVLDGMVVTAPQINTVINQGSGVISGSFTIKEAGEVALLLRAGALPAPLKIIEERTVGPSLGTDSIKSGAISILFGMAFVAGFMMLFYGFFGFIANVALFVNITIILSVLALLGATLTLPGMAGIVLTMGMSVDANVLIFERIKEELRDKKPILIAIEQGFSQAFRAITDSNITSLIIAFFLYAFGNGPVRGFAVTFSIGIIASMFSAIIVTRMIIAIWVRRCRPKRLGLC